jgi:hypothetical protein
MPAPIVPVAKVSARDRPQMNAFEVLGLEPRPLLDPQAVKEAHLAAMATRHPDAAGDNDPARLLNQARDLLARDRTRLRHLVELTRGAPLAERGAVPEEIGDLFNPLAELLGKVRGHLQAVANAESALEKASLLPQGLGCLDALQSFQGRLRDLRQHQTSRLQILDAAWMAGNRELGALEETALALAFLDKWSDQVDEQAFRLSETLV